MRSAWAGGVARASKASTSSVLSSRMVVASVREGGGVEEPAEPAHRIGTRQRAAAAVGDLGVADAVGGDAVVGSDIGGAHDALNLDQLVALVQAHLLAAADQQVAVAQLADHLDGDLAVEAVALGGVAGAGEVAAGLEIGRASCRGRERRQAR